MYKIAFLYICEIISDAILGSNCHPNATEAEIEKECSKWMRNWRDRSGGRKHYLSKIVIHVIYLKIKETDNLEL